MTEQHWIHKLADLEEVADLVRCAQDRQLAYEEYVSARKNLENWDRELESRAIRVFGEAKVEEVRRD